MSEQTSASGARPPPRGCPVLEPEPPSPSATWRRCRTAGTPRPGLPAAAPAAASPVQDSASCTGTRWLCAENGSRSLITAGPSRPGRRWVPSTVPRSVPGRGSEAGMDSMLPGSQTASDKLITTAHCWQAGLRGPGRLRRRACGEQGSRESGPGPPQAGSCARTHSSAHRRRRPPSLCPQAPQAG